MATKLISANLGVKLLLEVDGKEQEVTFSVVCPSIKAPQPYDVMYYLREFLEERLGIDIVQQHVEIAKPRGLKPVKHVTHEEFNRKIKELGY